MIEEIIRYKCQNPLKTEEEILTKIQAKGGINSGNFSIMDLRRIEYEAMRLYRRDIIQDVAPFGLSLYGDDGWKEIGHPNITYKGWLDNRKGLPKLYNVSKINLNIQIYASKTNVNKRTFDIPACGGFMLSNFKEDLVRLFKEGEEVVCFRDRSELPEMIDYYLKRPKARREIAATAQKRILKEHTFTHRMEKILSIMKEKI